jgi:hypothetical protein
LEPFRGDWTKNSFIQVSINLLYDADVTLGRTSSVERHSGRARQVMVFEALLFNPLLGKAISNSKETLKIPSAFES